MRAMKRALLQALLAARQANTPVAMVTRMNDGTQTLVYSDHQADSDWLLSDSQLQEIRDALRGARSVMLPGDELFVRSYVPAYRLLIIGAVHIAQALAPIARECGYRVIVIDPRRAFATPGRFRDVEVRPEWPDEALTSLAPDAQTAVVTLAHDPKIDDPALIAALQSAAFYIGALGSRRTHEKRLQRLTELGLAEQLSRINAPVGLDLGGRSHAEIAVAILAQLILARYKG